MAKEDGGAEDTGPPAAPEGQTNLPATGAAAETDTEANALDAFVPENAPCPSCQTSNPKGEEFCGNCGTPLAIPSNADSQIFPATPSKEMTPEELEEFKLFTLPKTPITVSAFGLTHVGLIKENNEDAFFVTEIAYPAHKMAVHVLIVADGMGGEPAGEVFGQMACYETWLGIRFLLPYFEQQHGFSRLDFWRFMDRQIAQHLQAQIASANSRIVRYGKMKQFKAGQYGAPIAVGVILCDLETGRVKVHCYNEGDVRCALVMGEKFKQLSQDQTIGGNPYRFLGRQEHIGGLSANWEIWLSELELQSFWVLTYSDGLWNMLSPEQMTQAAETSATPKTLCDLLLANALSQREPHGKVLGDEKVEPGDDNITIAAFRCENPKESNE